MFEPLPAKSDFPEAEKRVLEFWQKHDVFGKSLELRRGRPHFVFYEGPPTANGVPHPGHCLTRAVKDLFPRYQTMRGCLVERKAGWDTHGLPVEIEVCRELGINSKEEIEAYGVDKFVKRCIESVFRYVREWEEMTDRLGFWINLGEAYVTYHQSYVESVWWGLKTLFERGLLYQGHKVVWWWAQGGTALSAGEVGEGYRTVEDPSVYIRFPLVEEGIKGLRDQGIEGKVSLLVWTTTPWTLVSNHFAAVHPLYDYALVRDHDTDEYFYIAMDLVEPTFEKVKHKFEVLATCRGEKLVGLRYVPPFELYANEVLSEYAGFRLENPRRCRDFESPVASKTERVTTDTFNEIVWKKWRVGQTPYRSVGWRVVPAPFVTLDTGTGIVHIAPAFGEVDYQLWRDESDELLLGLPFICAVAPDGCFYRDLPLGQYRGRWVKDCDDEIMAELKERGILLHQELVKHEYPFCPRAEDDPLIQYARKSWFVRTSQFKEEFLKNNDAINWLPEHIKEGRFGDFLRNNVDWALSRERYWGTPLPIWVCEKTGKMEAIGSYAELLSKPGATDATPEYPQGYWNAKQAEAKATGEGLPEHLRVHKPYIDHWTYDSPFDEEGTEARRHEGTKGEGEAPAEPRKKARMRRVPDVIDCWWDAGSMPFAQWGFPHVERSVQTFAERFPCDFISEAIDQTRGWFYGLLAISTLLFGVDRSSSGSAGVPPANAARGVAPEPVTEEFQQRRRRKIPHWETGGSTYFITFSTAPEEGPAKRHTLTPQERDIALQACRHWDGERLQLHAVVVMPDHVHMLVTPLEREAGQWWPLADLMHSIKGFSAKEINRLRGSKGRVWQPEYFDRIIRTSSDFEEKWDHIVSNPVRKGFGDTYGWVWVEADGEKADAGRERGARGAERSGRDARAPQSPEAPARSYPHPYKTCVVLGHVMGEDGLKMSKRTGNYREPDYIFDHYGADAMRWYFFSAQTPWTSIRFQEAAIRDSQREFLVRLYNVFSFFNIYANIDGFEPDLGGLASGQSHPTGQRPVPQRSEIDRWISSELHRTIRFVRDALDRFENFPAAGRLNEFVDALSNWYVRRSRDRFWRPLEGSVGVSPANGPGVSSASNTGYKPMPQDQDKWDAYNTLYEVLVTLSKLIAPFTPFFAETMYQNLVRSDGETERRRDEGEGQSSTLPREAPISVHLCDYPEPDEALIDETLAQDMDLVRQIVSTGRAARTAAKLKVRQPLAQVEIILAWRDHEERLKAHMDLIAEELNVKNVEFTHEADHYVRYQVKPNFKVIGPKFGKLAPKVGAALGRLDDPAAARKTLLADGELPLSVDGQTVRLTKEDVDIRLEAKEGWSAAQGRAGVVVVSTELTPELREEGLMRELIHHVQGLRKQQDLAYEARITLYVATADEFLGIVRRYTDTISSECLAARIEFGAPPSGAAATVKVEGREIKLAIQTV